MDRGLLSEEGAGCYPLAADHESTGLTQAGVLPPVASADSSPSVLGCFMVEGQTATCPQCSRPISPEDTIVYGHGALGHLDCRRPRVLSAEERTLLSIYCRDHPVAECVRCTGKFHLREIVSPDQFGIRLYGCRWCHTDLTDSIRAHLYGCTMLPAEVRRRAAAARETAWNLVKQSHQLRDSADVLVREAEALLDENQRALRRSLRGRV